ncbi:MAG: PHP domain-containing protein, partial [Gammaproteobacteria bacterium]
MNYDLHCHSTCSDGTLSPEQLVTHAAECGVDVMALTDHDSTAGVQAARAAAQGKPIGILAGVEISVTWAGRTIHIVGLGVDTEAPGLQQGLAGIRETRADRAIRMGEKLEKKGVESATERAHALATGGLVARTHYARLLIEDGLASDVGDAIRKYLKPGKAGYVAGQWAALEDAVGWIVEAGGQAVIAHPARYNLTATKLRALIADFKRFGGRGIEVVSGSHSAQDAANMAVVARRSELHASRGSDYHGPENPWVEM